MPDRSASWDAALGRLYDVFARVPRPARVPGCPHCAGPGEDRRLLDGPVAAIGAGDLARYAAKALTTWGGEAEFRYFLPRLLECAAADAFGYPDPEIVFGRLAAAGWAEWPGEERAAVTAFLDAWWDETLRRHPSSPGIGTVLCSLAATGLDLGPRLRALRPLATEAAIAHLHDLATEELSGGRLTNPFWDRSSPGHAVVLAWLTGGPAAEAAEAAFARETREPVLELLAAARPHLGPGA
ncbi:hypothetical protein [Bailinhaonella thermotolerans]|uniref:Uncharacterized protein n=1 Tax=Bailinhaonella thermotolerans TaxID=1070861 RepID=A0A3A4A4T1_9ACTN|nr:hypothetical protein [Bailinhaonella thermotolerans]RJL22821.1 hypothetical protein D5H75_35170 [Bailinhaonella thermotolerans]